MKWKELTFLSLKEREGLDNVALTNLIVMGDADYEMEAGQKLSESLDHCVLKQIKMKEGPSPDELIK